MRATLCEFDIKELHATLNAARSARGLSWVALTAEMNRPFEGTPSIPISVGTIRGMRNKRTVASAVVLQVLRWLGRTPESFLSGCEIAASATEELPEPGQGRILRFDTRAMHTALNAERAKRGMTWKQLASELPGFTENRLTNLAKGSFDRLLSSDDDYPMAPPSCRKFRARSHSLTSPRQIGFMPTLAACSWAPGH